MELNSLFLLEGDMVLMGKLLLALILGLILGFERTIAGKMAGMRTYALVALGSCLLIVVTDLVTKGFIGQTSFDPLRLAAGIVTGVGFICGGIIIFTEQKLQGLTTAAGMWVATSIGIAVGYGLYTIAIFATILTLIVFSLLWKLEEVVQKVSNESARD